MEQGRIIETYATANIVERPGAERHLYQVTKATKSPQYGSLKPLLDDDNLEEIMYNHPDKAIMVAHRKHGMCVTNVKMSSEEATSIIQKVAKYVGREIGPGNLLLDGRIPDGTDNWDTMLNINDYCVKYASNIHDIHNSTCFDTNFTTPKVRG